MLRFTSCPNTTGPDTTYTVTYDGNENTGGRAPSDGNNYTEVHQDVCYDTGQVVSDSGSTDRRPGDDLYRVHHELAG